MLRRRYLNYRTQNSTRTYNRIICQTVFLRGFHAYCMRLRKVTKVTNPISDFAFLLTTKSGKSRIKNPFLDSSKGTHPVRVPFRELKIRRRRQRFRLEKQQLCTCITLFCTFLCRHCTTTTWNFLISVVSRFMENVNTRQQFSITFCQLRYRP